MEVVRDCKVDPEYFASIAECTETYGMDDHNPGSEWAWNVISTQATAYSCGAICRSGEHIEHCHSAEELTLCQRLAEEITQVAEDITYYGRSAADAPPSPFYVVANMGAQVPAQIDEALIRQIFGGTIYPRAGIWIEPLEERGDWWSFMFDESDWNEEDREDLEECLQHWRDMMNWFHSQPELHSPVFVQIGKDPLDEDFENGGCVLPRLALALTKSGSIVGIWTRLITA